MRVCLDVGVAAALLERRPALPVSRFAHAQCSLHDTCSHHVNVLATRHVSYFFSLSFSAGVRPQRDQCRAGLEEDTPPPASFPLDPPSRSGLGGGVVPSLPSTHCNPTMGGPGDLIWGIGSG